MAITKTKEKYALKNDTQSKRIVIILKYLGEQFTSEVNVTSSNLVERFQKIESEKFKDRSQTRVNTAKKKDYQRIHRNAR